MGSTHIFCPAKINAFLAVTGRRDDGYHELVSLVLPLAWGDELEVVETGQDGRHRIECDRSDVPCDADNLIWKAADAFARRTGLITGFDFRLTNRIPVGAGLGGGSSDAAGALKAINELAGHPLGPVVLSEVAAEIGSDCPLFLQDGPVVMRGRGEIVSPVPVPVREQLAGWRIVLFKPAFSISTAWAYRELARQVPGPAIGPEEAEGRLERLLADPDRLPVEGLNSFEPVVGRKFPAITLLLDRLRSGKSWWGQMSGSGSACFAVVRSDSELERVSETVQECWGRGSLLAVTHPC